MAKLIKEQEKINKLYIWKDAFGEVSLKASSIILLIVTGIMGFLYCILKGRAFQGYPVLKDIIIDQVALSGLNKTGEWHLFWGLLWGGVILIALLIIWMSLFAVKRSDVHTSEKQKNQNWKYASLMHKCLRYLPIFIPVLVKTVIYGTQILYIWIFSLILYACFIFFEEKGKELAACFLFIYFDGELAAIILSHYRPVSKKEDLYILLAASALLICLAMYMKLGKTEVKNSVFSVLFFTLQFPLPLLLFIYLKDVYQIGSKIAIYPYPVSYRIAIVALIFILYVMMILEYFHKKEIKRAFFSSAVSIFLFTSYIPGAMVVQGDLHHHGEQILPWQQIVGLHSQAYVDYFPVSGLFPMLIGGVNQLFFGNKATTYAISFTLLFIVFAILTIAMIRFSVDAYWTLLFAFVFQMPAYCRTWVILPALLAFYVGTKFKNKRRFFYLYIFICFLAGLYYPLFGLALVCAGMPYGFVHFVNWMKNGTAKNDIVKERKKPVIYIETLILVVPILISIPLLLAMAKHVLAYSNQTLLADGLALYANDMPDWFMSWGNGLDKMAGFRTFLYYGIRFMIPMIGVWALCGMLFRYLTSHKKVDTTTFYGLSASIITLIVSYTYTMVIQDEAWVSHLFSRTGHIFLWIFGIFVPIILINQGKELYGYSSASGLKIGEGHKIPFRKEYLIIALCMSIPTICFYNMRDYQFPSLLGAQNETSNVIGEYVVNNMPYALSEDMVEIASVDQSAFPNLGDGYIDINVLSNLYNYKGRIDALKRYDSEIEILGLDSGQLYYFLLGEKAPYSGKVSLAKSKKAANAVLPFINEHTIVGSDIRPVSNYYIYRELKKKGYLYDSSTGFYIPKSLFIKMYGEDLYVNSLDDEGPWDSMIYLSKAASSMGANVDHLKDVLSVAEINTPDFCYVKVDPMNLSYTMGCDIDENTYISIGWDGKVYFVLDFDQGEWLLPLAANDKYDESKMDELTIGYYDGASGTEVLSVRLVDVCDQIDFYHVR